MVAIETSEVLHVPPVAGSMDEFSPTHKSVSPFTTMDGFPLTVKVAETLEEQPVALSTKINVTAPAPTPVIIPELVMVATNGLLLIQLPPADGPILVVAPIQILSSPRPVMAGAG
jgi:hypothetical protein